MYSLGKIWDELKDLEYDPFHMVTPQGVGVVVINYLIPTGKYFGEEVLLGFSFKKEGYPEYPPHWIHISPPCNDHLGGSVQPYQCPDRNGVQCNWLALSRPPGQLWDNLPTKHMKYYLDFHVNRFLKNLK